MECNVCHKILIGEYARCPRCGFRFVQYVGDSENAAIFQKKSAAAHRAHALSGICAEIIAYDWELDADGTKLNLVSETVVSISIPKAENIGEICWNKELFSSARSNDSQDWRQAEFHIRLKRPDIKSTDKYVEAKTNWTEEYWQVGSSITPEGVFNLILGKEYKNFTIPICNLFDWIRESR